MPTATEAMVTIAGPTPKRITIPPTVFHNPHGNRFGWFAMNRPAAGSQNQRGVKVWPTEEVQCVLFLLLPLLLLKPMAKILQLKLLWICSRIQNFMQ
jgi:hypothetical protein